ncbi:Telomeric repeat-binding factor 2 [Senna tora]|uniref:Telomeric repeat-binding factor 2 n=1 Tax=Senna tora TaxID=362788 RepID=A0A835CD28_9FABA|nr:Telomeric repeat-binding factor 2 [Senna tora]
MELDNAAICSEKVGGNNGSEQLGKKAVISDDGNRESDEIGSPREIEIGLFFCPAFLFLILICEILYLLNIACQNSMLPDKHKHTASSTRQRGVKIIGDGSLKLQAAVTDPLPEILQKSDIVRSELAMKGISHEPPLENQSRDVDIPESNTCRSIVLYQPIDALLKNSFVNQSNVHCPNLMEQNSTAHTREWDDSIDNLPEGTPRKRRRGKRWTTLEEHTLVAGVNKFGKGNWKTILNFYSEIFKKADRTEVDLKDKWRNMKLCPQKLLIAPILAGNAANAAVASEEKSAYILFFENAVLGEKNLNLD